MTVSVYSKAELSTNSYEVVCTWYPSKYLFIYTWPADSKCNDDSAVLSVKPCSLQVVGYDRVNQNQELGASMLLKVSASSLGQPSMGLTSADHSVCSLGIACTLFTSRHCCAWGGNC